MEQLIEQTARELCKPAGESERFASADAIQKNCAEFVLRCHATWKKWHDKAVQQLLFHEGVLQREKTHPIGHGVKDFAEYNRAVWRRVNDTIIWTLLGMQRHRVKRLCFYRKRGNLLESNPDSAMAAVAAINAHPMSLALWNDATSCVDIGDLIVIDDGMNPLPRFIELKEGTVNEAIGAVLQSEEPFRDAAIKDFTARHGRKAAAQLNRVMRQKMIGDQALHLLIHEKGVDPLSGRELRVLDTGVAPQSYDETLAVVLQEALIDRKEAMACVDGCLWLFADADPRRGSAARFAERLQKRIAEFSLSRLATHPSWDKDKVHSLSAGVYLPMARPLFSRKLSPAQIASVTFGALRGNVWPYLDWIAFGQLIEKAGGTFRWGSKRDAGRARALDRHVRPPLIGGRLPQIQVEGVLGYISDPNLVEVFYDGITPWTLAQITVQNVSRAASEHRSTE